MVLGVLLQRDLMKTPQWLENLRQLPDTTKKRIVLAFLIVSIGAIIAPLIILQGSNNYRAALNDPSIQELKANISSEIEQYRINQAEIEKQKPKTDELVFGEDYVPPLKSTLDHNVSFAINARSAQIGSFLVLDVSLLNFGKAPARLDPMAIRVIQNGNETAPLGPGEWSPDVVALGKDALGSTLVPAQVLSGILVFPVKGPTFDLSVPDVETEDGTQVWSYSFSGVTLNPPQEKKSAKEEK